MQKQTTQTVAFFCWVLMFLCHFKCVFIPLTVQNAGLLMYSSMVWKRNKTKHTIKTVTKDFISRKRGRGHTHTLEHTSTHHQLPTKCWAHQHEDKQLTRKHLTFLSIFKVIQTAPPQPNHCCHPEAIMSGRMNGWLHCTHTIQLQANSVSQSNTPLALCLCLLPKMLSAEKTDGLSTGGTLVPNFYLCYNCVPGQTEIRLFRVGTSVLQLVPGFWGYHF